MIKTDLAKYRNNDFSHGRGLFVRIFWVIISRFFFETRIPYPIFLKCCILKFFGAKIGNGLILKPNVKIKHPWCLEVGSHCWVGEGVWIDNLVLVKLDANVCISQGALILTGNHNYKESSFDLLVGEIHLKEGVWIGAQAIVGPGVTCHSHSVLSAGSTTFKDLEPFYIYQNNVAAVKRKRKFNTNS